MNDLIRLAGELDDFHAGWKIPVERDGWDCVVSVCLYIWRADRERGLNISVSAFGYIVGKEPLRTAHYHGLSGIAPACLLTRRWVDQTLRREIETARVAALSFTEADLHECGRSPLEDFDVNEYRQEKEYFKSTLAPEKQEEDQSHPQRDR
jgi:hypothetical protein